MPAAALAFAAAAAAPGSAAAPPSGLSHGVSAGSGCRSRAPLGRRGPAILWARPQPAAPRRGKRFYERGGRLAPVWMLRDAGAWAGGAGPGPGGKPRWPRLSRPSPTPTPPGPAWRRAKRGSSQDGGGLGGGRGVSHRAGEAGARPVWPGGEEAALPLAAAWRMARLRGRQPGGGAPWPWRHVFAGPYAKPSCPGGGR